MISKKEILMNHRYGFCETAPVATLGMLHHLYIYVTTLLHKGFMFFQNGFIKKIRHGNKEEHQKYKGKKHKQNTNKTQTKHKQNTDKTGKTKQIKNNRKRNSNPEKRAATQSHNPTTKKLENGETKPTTNRTQAH